MTSKKRKKNLSSAFFAMLTIFSMVVFQFYPLSIAIAEESQDSVPAEEQADEESPPADEEEKTEESSEKPESEESVPEESPAPSADTKSDDPAENPPASDEISSPKEDLETPTSSASLSSENSETPEETGEFQDSFWESCSLDENESLQIENESCSPCREKPTCEEIKLCLKAIIENENTAIVENDASSSSNTGENSITEKEEPADASEENPTKKPVLVQEENDQTDSDENLEEKDSTESGNEIDTGDAIAETAVVNDVNANIVTDNGERSVENIENFSGDINLLEIFLAILEKADISDENRATAIEIFNKNYAQIENDVRSEANSGENSILGSGSIETGNAAAMVEIVNIANQNIVGSNWLLAIVNVFGTWMGDLIVPGEDLLILPAGTQYSNLEVINENSAEIENNALSEADTGKNSVAENEDPICETPECNSIDAGSAYSHNSVATIANTNIVKNNWFLLIINNMGSWIGSVFGYDKDSGSFGMIYSFDFASLLGNQGDDQPGGTLKVHNENYASVENSATATANTGGNEIAGSGNISTGNAYSKTAILNFVNSNFVGDNWLFGMLNIFGEWKGDLVFAYPDLEVSIDDGRNIMYPSQEFSYEITVRNNGKAAAHGIKALLKLPEGVLLVSGSPSQEMGSLAPGEEKEFSLAAKSAKKSPSRSRKMISSVSVSTETAEKELLNNSDTDETALLAVDDDDYDTKLSISRTVSENDGTVSSGKILHHSIVVRNKSDVQLYDVVLEDDVLDEGGNRITTYNWFLGNMEEDDALLIEYDIISNAPENSTVLIYRASARGEDPSDKEVRSRRVSLSLKFLGGTAYAADENFDEEIGSESMVPEANASVLGEISENSRKFPSWIWIASALAYFLAISWALFPNNKNHKLKQEI